MRSFCLVFFGIFILQFANGRLAADSSLKEETLHSYAKELLKPLMSKSNELNNTIQDYWDLYDKNMNKIQNKILGSRFSGLNELSLKVKDEKNDTCKDLKDTMTKAQTIVNNATVVLVQVLQKMASTIDKGPSCATINPFAAVSCLAHKAQDVKNIYYEYKNEIVEKEVAAARSIREILVEFIKCLKRLG